MTSPFDFDGSSFEPFEPISVEAAAVEVKVKNSLSAGSSEDDVDMSVRFVWSSRESLGFNSFGLKTSQLIQANKTDTYLW